MGKKLLQNPTEKIRYYIDHRNERESQILNVFKLNPSTWFSDMDVVKIVYAETPVQLWKAAARNVFQHLNKLEKECKIQSKRNSVEGDDLIWKYTS